MTPFSRDESVERIRRREKPWDLIVIGGGATGVGVALDAASRGLEVLLAEQSDFGKGTSSRSTKLVHGGVRYLRQGNVSLVRGALRERALLRQNAPHLVDDLSFLIPCRSLWQRFFYGIGLKLYDLLATGDRFGRSHGVAAKQAAELVPVIETNGLRGGVVYHDGQFDDARLLLAMSQSAAGHGACLVNYLGVTGLVKEGGQVTGVALSDHESGETFTQSAKSVVNATGPFCDSVRRLDDPDCRPMIAASQGVHVVLPRSFFPGQVALIVPKTSDGRVIFVIPWNQVVIVGTTDTPIPAASLEPSPKPEELDFLLETASEYLSVRATIDDALSVFTGVRPLVDDSTSSSTSSLSRDHVIRTSDSGLITVTGGKWTTVRHMSEDCVDHVIAEAGLSAGPCVTKTLALHGTAEAGSDGRQGEDPDRYYGTDQIQIRKLEADNPTLAKPLHDRLPIRGSQVVWATQHEMARTVDDVLSRRTRCLIYNARAAIEAAPRVAELMADVLKRDTQWQRQEVARFEKVAYHYVPSGRAPGQTDDESET